MLVAGYVVRNNTQHRDRYEDQDGFPRHFMIRPLATTNGADIFGLVKRGKAPRFPFQSGPSPRYAPRQSLENYRADRHGIASRCLSSGHAAGRVSASLVRKPALMRRHFLRVFKRLAIRKIGGDIGRAKT
jgi:hypothetical protein